MIPSIRRVDVKCCQRCGEDHEGLVFHVLNNPTDEWQWFALCPHSNQPILMKVVPSDDGADGNSGSSTK